MITTQPLIDHLQSIKDNCASLLQTARELYESQSPTERALAYEIMISVQRILEEQKPLYKQIETSEMMRVTDAREEALEPANGYGPLVD